MIQLGDKVKERISGFEGIVTGVTTFLNGCRQVCIRPAVIHEGKPVDGSWFDDTYCEVIQAGAIPAPSNNRDASGGPGSSDPRPPSQ